MRKLISIATIFLLFSGAANAGPLYVDPTAEGSSVSATMDDSGCAWCFINVGLSSGLEGAGASLDVGDSMTFDFFDIMVGGLIGSADVEIAATLALASPSLSIGASGVGGFSTFFFVLNAGSLTWIQPEAVDLGDGTFLGVAFENLFAFGIGNTATVSATITRFGAAAVPEPATAALFLIGLLVLWFISGRPALGISGARARRLTPSA